MKAAGRLYRVAILLLLVVVVWSCGSPFEAPLVQPEHSYREVEPNNNPSEAEETGFVLDGSTWYEIVGTFGGHDNDYFRVELGSGAREYSILTYRSVSDGFVPTHAAFGSNSFPIRIASVDVRGNFVDDRPLAGTAAGAPVETTASYLVIRVYERPPDLRDGEEIDPSYSSGMQYKIQIR